MAPGAASAVGVNGHGVSPHQAPEALVGGEFSIVLPGNQHLGKAEPVRLLHHAGKRQQRLETGCKSYKAFALVVIEGGVSAGVSGQAKAGVPRIPGSQRPISLKVAQRSSPQRSKAKLTRCPSESREASEAEIWNSSRSAARLSSRAALTTRPRAPARVGSQRHLPG